MDREELSTRKRVSVSQVKPGMYVVGFDRSWAQTPFFFHRKLIKNAEEIELLKEYGIREVVIDTARGANAESEPRRTPAATAKPAEKQPGSPRSISKVRQESHAFETVLRPLTRELQTARDIHRQALRAAQSIFDGVGTGAPVNSPTAKKVVTDLLETITRSPEANLLLIQMRRFESDLWAHSVNVCVLCLVLATLEGLESDAPVLGLGALLHDVGQTRIPRNLIRKQEPHTHSERRLIEQHPQLGAVLLRQNGDIPEPAQRIAVEHHERIDGSGYPFGIRGGQISPFSQIVGIVAAYDSMLRGRLQPGLQPIEVLRQLYLQGHAGVFDRHLIERIIRCLGVYPIGSLVELNTGERGIVIALNRSDSLRPTLRMISSAAGRAASNGTILNLADADSGSIDRRIIRALDPGKERVDVMAYLKPSLRVPK